MMIDWKRLASKRKILLLDALNEYESRQARTSHPRGEFDSGGRWFPHPSMERQPCCDKIRQPSRSYPYSLNLHCRSKHHVASLYAVDEGRMIPDFKELYSK